jgi:hypothetical protein
MKSEICQLTSKMLISPSRPIFHPYIMLLMTNLNTGGENAGEQIDYFASARRILVQYESRWGPKRSEITRKKDLLRITIHCIPPGQ